MAADHHTHRVTPLPDAIVGDAIDGLVTPLRGRAWEGLRVGVAGRGIDREHDEAFAVAAIDLQFAVVRRTPVTWSSDCIAEFRGNDYNREMLDWTSCTMVERSPEKVSGAWVFRGTRVPVKALFNNLEDGATVDQFLEWFPGVTREQALAVVDLRRASI